MYYKVNTEKFGVRKMKLNILYRSKNKDLLFLYFTSIDCVY
jgi:hypothetical protein